MHARKATSSSKAAASTAFARLVAGKRVRALLVGCAPVQARRHRRSPACASSPTARSTASRGGCRRPTCATRRPRRSSADAALALAQGRARRGLGRRFRALSTARPIAADAPFRARRPQLRVRARRRARRGADPPAARGERRRAHGSPSRSSTCRRASSAASRKCAARTTRSPASPSSPPACSTAWSAASLGALWLLRQHWLVWKRAARRRARRRRAARGDDPRQLPRPPGSAFDDAGRESTFWVRQVGLALLVLVGGGLALGEVFMAAEGLTRRAFPHHPQLWRVWSRDAARDARDRRTHRRRLSLRPRSSSALIAAFYFADQPLAGLVAAVRAADRSQHPVVGGAGVDADRDFAAGGHAWRNACSAPFRWRSAR